MDRTRRTTRRNPLYALLAGAILALLVMPLAFAGAADGPQASTSASTKQQIKKLKSRITLLEGKVGEARPSRPRRRRPRRELPEPDDRPERRARPLRSPANTLTGPRHRPDNGHQCRRACEQRKSVHGCHSGRRRPSATRLAEGLSSLRVSLGAGVAVERHIRRDHCRPAAPAARSLIGGGHAWHQNGFGRSDRRPRLPSARAVRDTTAGSCTGSRRGLGEHPVRLGELPGGLDTRIPPARVAGRGREGRRRPRRPFRLPWLALEPGDVPGHVPARVGVGRVPAGALAAAAARPCPSAGRRSPRRCGSGWRRS